MHRSERMANPADHEGRAHGIAGNLPRVALARRLANASAVPTAPASYRV